MPVVRGEEVVGVMTPIYDALVIEREGHPSDDDIAAATAAWVNDFTRSAA